MSDPAEFIVRWLVALFLCCGLTFLGAYNNGRHYEKRMRDRELVEHGYAFYAVDPKTGETTLRMKEPCNEQ